MSELIEAKQDIKRAVSAAIFVAALDALLALLSLLGTKLLGTDLWILIDVVVVLALAYGIHRTSRTCAVLMFVYYLLLCFMMIRGAGLGAIIIRAIFLFYFGTGMLGTFKFHRLNRKPE